MTRKRTFRILFIGIIAFLVGLAIAVSFYADFLFFGDIGYSAVFLKMLSARFLMGLLFGLTALVFVAGNLLLSNRFTFSQLNVISFVHFRTTGHRENIGRAVKTLSIIAAFAFAFICGNWGSALWKEALLFAYRTPAGVTDPIFGKDIGFYLFSLPFLHSLRSFAGTVFIVSLLLVAAGYFFRGAVLLTGNSMLIDSRARRHLSLLGGLFVLHIAAGFYLDQFGLLTSPHNIIVGAGYTDINMRLLTLKILVALTTIAAIVFVAGSWKGRLKMAVVPLGLVAAVYLIGFLILPAALQSLKVSPNELELEKPYIEHHIKATRFAYDLERITVRPFDPGYTLEAADIERNDPTIKNIRLWDDEPLLKTYSQLQQIRTYYRFTGVDNDRYTVNGQYRQVMLSPRELSYADLPSRSWINERMIFTHGNGVAMGPVSRITREGLPEFIIKDIPPSSSANVKVTRPEIYYGELSSDYVIVKTRLKEFSYPTSEGNVYTSYEGGRGVTLDSPLRKAVFAFKFGSAKILLSSDITDNSRILYNREIKARVQAVTPFLIFDRDPYIVVSDDGKLKWIIDAYTTSDGVPYAKQLNRNINYIRNSVKAIIDAYDGSVDFYISDPKDVLIKVYNRMFPGLFKPLTDMPGDLVRHIRYPQELFQVQASMLAVYHMTDPKVFYNKEDLWEIPAHGQSAMSPYYTIMKLPEEKATKGGNEEYILLLPFTPSKRDNLAAWLAARCDGENYGNMVVYSFPKDRLVFGPRQVSARIDQDSFISQQLTLWGQKGSRVIRGSLLVIPIERSLLYVQPLYLVSSDAGGLPELRRVIVAYENDVVMEENLEAGLLRLFGQRRGAPARDKERVPLKADASVGQLAKEAMQIFEKSR
jgi:uncharacterized membrane protein (UPF0182 family)